MAIIVTKKAKYYFSQLINSQLSLMQVDKLNLRIVATNCGNSKANIELSYCQEYEQNLLDIPIDCGDFTLYVDNLSEPALQDAVIDYQELNNELSIKAPFLKKPIPENLNNIETRIKNFLFLQIIPYLEKHGGKIELKAINPYIDDKKKKNDLNKNLVEVVLEFSGGCKGCSMVDITLKHNIEKLLKKEFPEIALVSDVTNHLAGKNPFFS